MGYSETNDGDTKPTRPPRAALDMTAFDIASFRSASNQPSASITLPALAESAAAARRFVRSVLGDWNRSDLVDRVELLTSEVVTNAVIHAESDARLDVVATDGGVRVAVFDDGAGVPTPRDASPTDTGGRGLAMVDAVADDWGVEHADGGKLIWFTVEV